MVASVTRSSTAVPEVRHVHQARWSAGQRADRSHAAVATPSAPSSDTVQVSARRAEARQSIDAIRQAAASGDAGALRQAVHAFRVHDDGDGDDAGAAAAAGATTTPQAEHGHGRKALMAELGKALSSGDLEAARKAFADLAAQRERHAHDTPAQQTDTVGSAASTPATATETTVPNTATTTPPAVTATPVVTTTTVPDITAVPPAATAADTDTGTKTETGQTAPTSATPATGTAIAPGASDPLAALGKALEAGDLDAARKAFADLAAQRGGHHHHHHHHHHDATSGEANAAPATAATTPAAEPAAAVPAAGEAPATGPSITEAPVTDPAVNDPAGPAATPGA